MKNIDIDYLLDSTKNYTKEAIVGKTVLVDIDKLLEETEGWK